MQIRFTQFIIALHLVVFGLYLFSIFQQNINIITQFSPLVVAFLGLIFLVLGLRGIRKDEALIKSLDRLR
jgi:succinate-acetate transporter protein